MRINEKGTNMEITDSIRDYLYKKLEHLEKFIDPTDESVICDVELGRPSLHHKNGDVFRAEINIHIAGNNLRAVSKNEDLYSAIDETVSEIGRSLKSNKEKQISLIRRGGAKVKNIVRGLFNKNS